MDENKEADKEECDHLWKHILDEYGSLAQGGSYEFLECQRCGKTVWSALPD